MPGRGQFQSFKEGGVVDVGDFQRRREDISKLWYKVEGIDGPSWKGAEVAKLQRDVDGVVMQTRKML